MTALVSLYEIDDFTGDVASLSLIDPDGLSIKSWGQALPDEDGVIIETMTLQAYASSYDNLAGKFQALEDYLTKIEQSKSPVQKRSVWLRVRGENETNARQAVLVGYKRGKKVNVNNAVAQLGNFVQDYTISFYRRSWEAISSGSFSAVGISTLGGVQDYSAVTGDLPARLAEVAASGVFGQSNILRRFWGGFRTNLYGDKSQFVPYWSFDLGTKANSTANSTADGAQAKTGTHVACTFGDGNNSLLNRVNISCWQASGFDDDKALEQRGIFLVLLRARAKNAATAFNVRLGEGHNSTTQPAYKNRLPVTTNSWKLYPVGIVQIPSPGRAFSTKNLMRNYAIFIDAERTTGGAGDDLYMDGAILIPYDEGFFFGDGGAIVHTGLASTQLALQETPEGRKQAIATSSSTGSPATNAGVPIISRGVPLGAGRMVVAAEQDTVSNKNDNISFGVTYFRRWTTLRGSE